MEQERYHAEDVIPVVLTLIIAVLLVLAASSSLRAVTLADQCGPAGLASARAEVAAILDREGTSYRVETPEGGSWLPQDARLTRVQLRQVLHSTIAPCVEYLGPAAGWEWRALHDQVTAAIARREQAGAWR
ncbi:MAG TPA: hypothetical protein VKZ69_03930 [Limnochordales bacterium]|nr:hypothetical protein [Limnochordales bacterium]